MRTAVAIWLALAGLALAVAGGALISPGAALIVGGSLLFGLAVLLGFGEAE